VGWKRTTEEYPYWRRLSDMRGPRREQYLFENRMLQIDAVVREIEPFDEVMPESYECSALNELNFN